MNENTNEIAWFKTNGKKYYLKEPIILNIEHINVTYDLGYYWTQDDIFDLQGMGGTERKCVNDARIELGQRYEWKFETEISILSDISTDILDDIFEWINKVDSIIDWEKSSIVIINVSDYVDDNKYLCDVGYDIFIDIIDNFYKGKSVYLSFKDIDLILPYAVNTSICQLYKYFDESFINKHLYLFDLSDDDVKMISWQIRKAKRYFKNPELYKKIRDECDAEYY